MFSELIHYSLVLFFYTPRKQKTFRFSDVFRGIEKEHRAVIKIYVFWFLVFISEEGLVDRT